VALKGKPPSRPLRRRPRASLSSSKVIRATSPTSGWNLGGKNGTRSISATTREKRRRYALEASRAGTRERHDRSVGRQFFFGAVPYPIRPAFLSRTVIRKYGIFF